MKKFNILVSFLVALSLFAIPAFAQPVNTGEQKCTIPGPTEKGLDMSLARISGLCKEFFVNPQQLTFFVLLPAVLFGIIIYGVLEEIGLFNRNPGIHVAMAILLSAMLLPSGVFGKVALTIYSAGAMAAVLSVGGVFILGLTFWVRRKTHQFGYGGVFGGAFGNVIVAVGMGFIGYMLGSIFGGSWNWTGAIGGGIFGFFWGMFSKKGSMLKGGAIDKRISELEKRMDALQKQRDGEQLRYNALPPTATAERAAAQANINSMQTTMDTVNTEMKELYEKRSAAYTSV